MQNILVNNMIKNRLSTNYTLILSIISLVTCSPTLPMNKLISFLGLRSLSNIEFHHQRCLWRCSEKYKSDQNPNQDARIADYNKSKDQCDDITIKAVIPITREHARWQWERSSNSEKQLFFNDKPTEYQRCMWRCGQHAKNDHLEDNSKYVACKDMCDAAMEPTEAISMVKNWRKRWENIEEAK